MVELIDIINASKGKNANGESKSGISISEQIMNQLGDVRTLRENVFSTPEINVMFNGDFVLFDLKFPSESAIEMRMFWNYCEKFGKEQHNHFGTDETPVLHLSVMPLEFSGKYFYTLINPICWTLQPSAPGAPINTIRLLFENEALNIFQSEGVDEKEIETEMAQEDYEQERLRIIEEEKSREHEEYLTKLNERFNSRQ